MRYLPTADGAAAGGDFYDALALSGGRLGIAVGDVVGHGPGAAAAMGQLRSALRAYALEGRAPARVLQLLSRYAEGVPGARGATVVYAVIDPGAREVRYATAGHPPPLLLAPGEAPRYLNGARGVPLDRALGHVYTDATASLAENGTLILYSDGAIERRGEGLEAGLARLAGAGGRRAGPRGAGGPAAGDRSTRAARTTSRCSSRACTCRRSRRCGCGSPPGPTSSRSCARRCAAGWRRPAWTAATPRCSCSPRPSCARTRSSTRIPRARAGPSRWPRRASSPAR